MARMGLPLTPEAVLEEEASWIPLGGGLPKMPQRNVAFGAAAGLVHPGSGFSLYNSYRSAQDVADAIASNLEAGTPESAAAAAYEARAGGAVSALCAVCSAARQTFSCCVPLRAEPEKAQRSSGTARALACPVCTPPLSSPAD